jgi:predicted DNA binding CopG/RHH family protein
MSRQMIPLRDPADVPADMTEEQARAFWNTHEITEEYLERAAPVPADALPPAGSRSTHIALRIPQDTLDRVKALAAKRGRGYQTLIKQFLVERLYEEEKREGLVGGEQRR